eukprot:GHVT01042463.1.p1 GENE.GHVT01042463.1~~GHVT01042463.1.p1  ORF type:complete len:174 (-),score=15.08 GHVT01042463.1:295-816(-)
MITSGSQKYDMEVQEKEDALASGDEITLIKQGKCEDFFGTTSEISAMEKVTSNPEMELRRRRVNSGEVETLQSSSATVASTATATGSSSMLELDLARYSSTKALNLQKPIVSLGNSSTNLLDSLETNDTELSQSGPKTKPCESMQDKDDVKDDVKDDISSCTTNSGKTKCKFV